MEKGDIGISIQKHVACMFEGLLCTVLEDAEIPKKRRFWNRDEPIVKDKDMDKIIRSWRPNEFPIKSVIALATVFSR